MFNDGLLWFIIGVGATVASIALYQWLTEKKVSLKWWEWLLVAAWTLLLAFSVTAFTTNLGLKETRAAWLSLLIYGGITVIAGALGWYLVLRRKFAAST